MGTSRARLTHVFNAKFALMIGPATDANPDRAVAAAAKLQRAMRGSDLLSAVGSRRTSCCRQSARRRRSPARDRRRNGSRRACRCRRRSAPSMRRNAYQPGRSCRSPNDQRRSEGDRRQSVTPQNGRSSLRSGEETADFCLVCCVGFRVDPGLANSSGPGSGAGGAVGSFPLPPSGSEIGLRQTPSCSPLLRGSIPGYSSTS